MFISAIRSPIHVHVLYVETPLSAVDLVHNDEHECFVWLSIERLTG